MGRRTARETAVQLLFESEFHAGGEDTLALTGQEDFEQKDLAYIRQTLSGVQAELGRIDPLIEKYAAGWALDRMPKVDKSILRLAVYEILYTDVPGSVAISEAVELAHVFSSDEAVPFINGVLGSFLRDYEGGRI